MFGVITSVVYYVYIVFTVAKLIFLYLLFSVAGLASLELSLWLCSQLSTSQRATRGIWGPTVDVDAGK